jgi:hypothetical protein
MSIFDFAIKKAVKSRIKCKTNNKNWTFFKLLDIEVIDILIFLLNKYKN